MPGLKDLRNRIRSVRSTQKITAAMKMVAASRLRRAQEQAEAARPYATRMERGAGPPAERLGRLTGAPERKGGLFVGPPPPARRPAGGSTPSSRRGAPRHIRQLDNAGKTVKIL